MGVKHAQAELNAVLKPIFSHIPNVYLIHGDLIIITRNTKEDFQTMREVMEVIKSKNLTLTQTNLLLAQRKQNFEEFYFPRK